MTAGYVDHPTAALTFLLGPTTDPTTDTENASIVRLSANSRTDALIRAAQAILQDAPNPWVTSARKAGTLSIDAAGNVTGTATAFLADFAPYQTVIVEVPAIRDPLGEGFLYQFATTGSPSSDTVATGNAFYAVMWAASVGSVTNTFYRVEVPTINGSGNNGVIEQFMYYEFPGILYQAAYKHADHADGATLMANADAVAKKWWDYPLNATARRAAQYGNPGDIWPGSRHAALTGLLVWALRDCPGQDFPNTATNVFNYCSQVALAAYNQWLAGKGTAPGIPYDTRDGGYALHWLVMLSKVHPDAGIRADCRTKWLDAALNYFIRLQYPDGSFRATNDPWYNTATGLSGYPVAQPFLTALLLLGLVDGHRSIRDDPAYAVQAAAILASVKLGVDGLMRAYGGSPDHPAYTAFTGSGNAEVRAFTYAYGGPDFGFDAVTPANLIPSPNPDGNRWYDPKATIENAVAGGTTLADAVAASRFLNSTSAALPYYAAIYSTGSVRARYLAFGDELLESQWAYTDGDGLRSQWYTPPPKNKDWDEHMRAQMRGLAWRKLAVAGAVTDTPGDLVEGPPPTPPPDSLRNPRYRY